MILHSDRGSQFTSKEFTDFCKDHVRCPIVSIRRTEKEGAPRTMTVVREAPLSDAGLQELSPTLNQSNAGFSFSPNGLLLYYFVDLRRLQMMTAIPAAANVKRPP